MVFNRNRVRTISYKLQNSDLQFLVDDWKPFVTKILKFPKHKFSERRIMGATDYRHRGGKVYFVKTN